VGYVDVPSRGVDGDVFRRQELAVAPAFGADVRGELVGAEGREGLIGATGRSDCVAGDEAVVIGGVDPEPRKFARDIAETGRGAVVGAGGSGGRVPVFRGRAPFEVEVSVFAVTDVAAVQLRGGSSDFSRFAGGRARYGGGRGEVLVAAYRGP